MVKCQVGKQFWPGGKVLGWQAVLAWWSGDRLASSFGLVVRR